jgi:hypothetical protein
MYLQHPPATTSRVSGVSNTGVGHGWCVRRGWEDAAIRSRVPDITHLALRRLVTLGVLEELSTAASLDRDGGWGFSRCKARRLVARSRCTRVRNTLVRPFRFASGTWKLPRCPLGPCVRACPGRWATPAFNTLQTTPRAQDGVPTCHHNITGCCLCTNKPPTAPMCAMSETPGAQQPGGAVIY